jgi:glycosyltransferase involved in cell wall biosynthesis
VTVCFIAGREPTYIRNAMILKGLTEQGIEIIECTDCSSSYLLRYPNVLKKFMLNKRRELDLVFVGFFGQPLVPIIRKLTGKPIIFDAFLSAYDTMCFDRKKFKPSSIGGRFFYKLDKYSCQLADKVLLDTDAHISYFIKTFGLDKGKFNRVFVGADDSIFYPREVERGDDKFRVFYYGTYRPLQGIEYIIEAAKRLESYEDIEFEVVGKGPEHKGIMELVQELNVKNIKFIDWIPYEKLPLEIAKADVCLGGHFSDIDKAKRVIAGKIFQFIAMRKPVIVGDSPANRELFQNKENALMCQMANADALAKAILELRNNPPLREKIAEQGYKVFLNHCTPKLIGSQIKEIITELVGR